jgi:hypothetical protein
MEGAEGLHDSQMISVGSVAITEMGFAMLHTQA